MQQQFKFGDITDVQAGLILHGCNAQGVMGSGVAKAIRDKYPENYDAYKSWEQVNGLKLGDIVLHNVHEDLTIVNAITQENYGKDGKKYVSYQAVLDSVLKTAQMASRYRMAVHYPLMGAGLGGGDWAIIQSILDYVFDLHAGVQHTLWIKE